MLPGREAVVMGVDLVVALMDLVYCGDGNGHLVGRDCFLECAPTECPHIYSAQVSPVLV